MLGRYGAGTNSRRSARLLHPETALAKPPGVLTSLVDKTEPGMFGSVRRLGLKSMGITLEERNDDEHKSPSNLRVN
jgi:hypothetical protein